MDNFFKIFKISFLFFSFLSSYAITGLLDGRLPATGDSREGLTSLASSKVDPPLPNIGEVTLTLQGQASLSGRGRPSLVAGRWSSTRSATMEEEGKKRNEKEKKVKNSEKNKKNKKN